MKIGINELKFLKEENEDIDIDNIEIKVLGREESSDLYIIK